MSQIHFSGPVEVTPDLLMAMWNAMPESGRAGVAQIFFSNYTRPLPDAVLSVGAKTLFEREKIPQAAMKRMKDAVLAKAAELGTTGVNEQHAAKVVAETFQKAAEDWAKANIDRIMAGMDMQSFASAAVPGATAAIAELAKTYFTRTQNGQNQIMGLIHAAFEQYEEELKDAVRMEAASAAKPELARRFAGAGNTNGAVDNAKK